MSISRLIIQRSSLFSSLFSAAKRLAPLPLNFSYLSLPRFIDSSPEPSSFSFPFFHSACLLSTQTPDEDNKEEAQGPFHYQTDESGGDITDDWEEEDEAEPKLGDGGDGGGVVLQGVPWGDRVLLIAYEVLKQFGDGLKLYAFKTTPRGYIYVRLDKVSTEYGCPSMEELESYCREYRTKLDDAGTLGEIPDDLAVEVSSPGAERILKVPDDLSRFKDMPMTVCYEDTESNCPEKSGVFMLDSIETEAGICVWKLANVKENRDPESKGRPLSRKQKEWRLKLPFTGHRKITLYLEY
ncbi:hypothetical protein SLE2022_124410 [Rubroshorea leprosula]